MTPEQQHARTYQDQQKAYERKWRIAFNRILNGQLTPVLRAIQQGLRPNPDLLISAGSFAPSIIELYETVGVSAARREYYWQRAMAGNEEKANIVDFFLDRWRLIFRNYAREYAYRVDNGMTETTREQVREELERAYEEGITGNKLITRIKRVIGAKNRIRATNIARTETTAAANIAKETGAREYAASSGDKMYKGWISRVDERTRQAHLIENNHYIEIDDKFVIDDPKTGRIECDRPGDLVLPASQRCMCRCVCVYISERRYLRLVERGEAR